MRRFAIGALALTSLTWSAAIAQITGSLSDWGVTLSGNNFTGSGSSWADWRPFGLGSNGHSSTAPANGTNSGISYSIWDGYGPHGSSSVGSHHNLRDFGGQQFDVKALYVKSDGVNLYMGVVTGFNPGGTPDPYGRPITYAPGDFAINPNQSLNTAEYGLLLPTTSAPVTGSATIIQGGTWNIPNEAQGFSNSARTKYKSGGAAVPSVFGTYTYAAIMYSGNPVKYSDPVTGNDVPLYLIEGSIPLTAMNKQIGDTVDVLWGMSCSNDYIDTRHTIVPEPTSISALAGLLAALGLGKRRRG